MLKNSCIFHQMHRKTVLRKEYLMKASKQYLNHTDAEHDGDKEKLGSTEAQLATFYNSKKKKSLLLNPTLKIPFQYSQTDSVN